MSFTFVIPEQDAKTPSQIDSELALRRAYYQVARHAGSSRLSAWRGARRLARKDWQRRSNPRWPDDYTTVGLHGTGWM